MSSEQIIEAQPATLPRRTLLSGFVGAGLAGMVGKLSADSVQPDSGPAALKGNINHSLVNWCYAKKFKDVDEFCLAAWTASGSASASSDPVIADDWQSAVRQAVTASATVHGNTYSFPADDGTRFTVGLAGDIGAGSSEGPLTGAASSPAADQKVLALEDGTDGDFNDDYWALDVARADLQLQGLPEEDQSTTNEIDPGGDTLLNADDDNDNGIPDNQETAVVAGENDLVPLTIDDGPEAVRPGASVTLSLVAGSDKVKVWLSPEKGDADQLVLGAGLTNKTWTVGGVEPIPSTVYIEGVATSTARADIGIRLTVVDGSATAYDEVRDTVPPADLDVTDNGVLGDPEDGVANYLPGYVGGTAVLTPDSPQHVNVIVQNLEPGRTYYASLADTTSHPGIASNADSNVGGVDDPDYELDDTVFVADTSGALVIGMLAKDFGGKTKVQVSNGEMTVAELEVPKDTDGDKLPDAWEEQYAGNDLPQGFAKFEKDNKQNPDTNRDDDRNTGANPPQNLLGDRFPAYDEYRGFMKIDPQDGTKDVHIRTSPVTKDVFVYSLDKDPYLAQQNNADGLQDNPANGEPIWIGNVATKAPLAIHLLRDTQFWNQGAEPDGANNSPKGDVNFNSPAPLNGIKQKRVWIKTDLTRKPWAFFGARLAAVGQVGPNSTTAWSPTGVDPVAASWIALARIRSEVSLVDGDGTVSAGPGLVTATSSQGTQEQRSNPRLGFRKWIRATKPATSTPSMPSVPLRPVTVSSGGIAMRMGDGAAVMPCGGIWAATMCTMHKTIR